MRWSARNLWSRAQTVGRDEANRSTAPVRPPESIMQHTHKRIMQRTPYERLRKQNFTTKGKRPTSLFDDLDGFIAPGGAHTHRALERIVDPPL